MFLSSLQLVQLEPLFATVDLYEEKAPSKVIKGLAVFARHVSLMPTWSGACLLPSSLY